MYGSVTMKNKYSILIAAIAVAVNLCHGYSIKQPGPYTASYTKSSASASAFSHASSSSYTFGENVDPNHLEKLQEALKTGAVASASAVAGATANAGAVASAGAATKAGAVAGSGSIAGSGLVASGNGAYSGSAQSGAGNGFKEDTSECSGGCNGGHNSNTIFKSSSPLNAGAYKVIGSDKYTTGYSSGSKTNYAISGNYVHGQAGRRPFPGPSGSIHDYKPASSVPAVPHTGAVSSFYPSHTTGGSSIAQSSAASVSSASQQSVTVNNLPGSSTSIHSFKPSYELSSGSKQQTSGSDSGYVSPSLIATFPGPSGSIHDSKPAIAGAASGASASAISGTYNQVASQPVYHSPAPVPTPSCSLSPGSPNCGAASRPLSGPGLTQIISILPGPSGSIYDSKPIKSASAVHGTGSAAGTGSSSGAYSGTGSVSNIPATHPIVGPVCSYSPGSPNKCGSPIGDQSNAAVEAGNNAPTHPGKFPGPSGSIHAYKPVSSNKPSSPISSTGSHIGGGTNVVAGSLPSVSSGSESGSYNGGESVVNIPSTHPVVGSVCTYTPGSPNNCGSSSAQHGSQTNAEAVFNANAATQAGTATVSAPSIHPQAPLSGTYYINKPGPAPILSTDIQPPLISSSPSFSGQIPCTDSSCGFIQKSPEPVPSLQSSGNCGSGSSCGGQTDKYSGSYSGSSNSAESGVVYVDKDNSDKYQSINHDQTHLSGGIVYQKDDGSYENITPTSTRPTYKNSENHGYAVSSNAADSNGILIGPGTGHLPVETDAKPFGTQGAFGGSAAFTKTSSSAHTSGHEHSLLPVKTDPKPFASQGAFGGSNSLIKVSAEKDKPFGTQGAFGGSAAFSKALSSAHSTEIQSVSGNDTPYATGDVTIQKSEGILVPPVDGSDKPSCFTNGCASGSTFVAGSVPENSYSNDKVKLVNPIKLQCTGGSCGDTEVIVIEEKPASNGPHSASGYEGAHANGAGFAVINQGVHTYDATNAGANPYEGSYSGSGQLPANQGGQTYDLSNSGINTANSNEGAGFATGQVVVNQGGHSQDITNSGLYAGTAGTSYSGSGYRGSSGSPGCSFGRCSSQGIPVATSYGSPSPAGLLNKLFGAGVLSSAGFHRYGGSAPSASAAYSSAGSYAGASAGSFGNAGASAHAGSYARSF